MRMYIVSWKSFSYSMGVGHLRSITLDSSSQSRGFCCGAYAEAKDKPEEERDYSHQHVRLDIKGIEV